VNLDTMPVDEVARLLGSESPAEWVTYRGRSIADIAFGTLLQTDLAFQQFWIARLESEVRVFERILQEADFLDQSVKGFFDITDDIAFVPGERTMGDWALDRLLRAQESLHLMFS
jgi:hypothetical protein